MAMIKKSRVKQPRDIFVPRKPDRPSFNRETGRVCLICGEPLNYVLKSHVAKHGYTDREKFIAEQTVPMRREFYDHAVLHMD